MVTLDIVDLIEKNPITRLSSSYNSKLLMKIKINFTETHQQIFVSSLYSYLNHNQYTDYIINLDNIWKWLGFYKKCNATVCLDKNFIKEVDYLNFAPERSGAKNTGRGGHNKHKYMLTIRTFKSLCLKAGTKKADEIHEYFIKLEELLYEMVMEESDELKVQLEQKNKIIEDKDISIIREKELLVEKTLISQFPINTQCIYYGKIDNKSGGKPNSKLYHESLVKFGQSNNLGERIKCHKRNFDNFILVGAFKVKNKIEIENAIKRHPELKKRIRSLTTIENPNFKEETYRELLALDDNGFTISQIHDYFEEIIKETEYNIENYNILLKKNDELEGRIRDITEKLREKTIENEKMVKQLEKYTSDITSHTQKKIANDYAICKYSYFLYAFDCGNMNYKCSITRQKDFEILKTNLTNLDKKGNMKYYVKVQYPFSEKIMAFLLKQSQLFTSVGNNCYCGNFHDIKQIFDITANLEKILIDNGKDLVKLNNIIIGEGIVTNKNIPVAIDYETPPVRKAKRSIDQINHETGEVINTYESIESAGRALGLTTGTAIGIALREKRICKGFIWRYTGISKEDQYNEQPVIKICCKTGENTAFTNIASAAKDSQISAPALRQRILTNVHCNNCHWVFDKSASHYNG